MRIIAGEFRRRLLLTPKDAEVTRPIPDRVKESLFSLLRGHCEGATVFDAFAGTGAIGLEAVSRGATRCVMVEKDRDIADILRKNVETLGVKGRCEVVVGDALGPGALARAPRPLKLAFLDPPYPIVRDPLGYQRVVEQLKALVQLLTDDGYAVLRTPWPLRHQEGGEQAESTPEPRRWKKKGKGRRDRDGRRGFEDEAEEGRRRGSPKPSAKPTKRVEELDPEGDFGDHDLDLDELGLEADEFGERTEEEAAALKAQAAGGATDTPTPVWKDVNLKVEGALGPETHVYGSMAVHLYMKAKP
jgi:16S rRNA (guanine966-N2)-methyltransferase